MEHDTEKQIAELFGRHVIALTWWEGVPNGRGGYKEKPKFRVASGFLIEMFEMCWLVTAGHVNAHHQRRKRKEGIVAFDTQVWDFFGTDSSTRVAYPWDFFDSTVWAFECYDEELGFDFAFLNVPYLVGKALSQNISLFRKIDWVNQAGVEYDKFVLCGLPGELGSIIEWEEDGGVSARPGLCLAVLQISEVKEECSKVKPTKFPQFVGQLTPAETVNDISGMSGGPILGLKKLENGELRYFPVAIQSRWLRKKRIVIGCYIEPFGLGIEAKLQAEYEKWQGEKKMKRKRAKKK
jgi:hypothetical protein